MLFVFQRSEVLILFCPVRDGSRGLVRDLWLELDLGPVFGNLGLHTPLEPPSLVEMYKRLSPKGTPYKAYNP